MRLMSLWKYLRRDTGIPEYYRADGRIICRICGKTYYKHSYDSRTSLNRLCNGKYVKL